MNLNFEQMHREYLTGRKGEGGWYFTPANSSRPGADFYAASHQIFSNNALSVSLLIRNTMDEQGRVTGASPLLALAFSTRRNGRYLLANDPNKIVIPLSLDQAIEMYAFLRGGAESVLIEVIRPGIPPKYLRGFVANGSAGFRFILKAHTTEQDEAHKHIDISLTAEHVFHLQAFMLSLGALVYPWMSLEMVSQLYLSSAGKGDGQTVKAGTHTTPSAPQSDAVASPVPALPQQEQGMLSSAEAKSIERVSTAVFAVGINKWPAKRRDVIRYIQETASLEQMDRLIKAGNAGDFSEWNRIADLMD